MIIWISSPSIEISLNLLTATLLLTLYINFAKAFDTEPRKLLIITLKAYGISGVYTGFHHTLPLYHST